MDAPRRSRELLGAPKRSQALPSAPKRSRALLCAPKDLRRCKKAARRLKIILKNIWFLLHSRKIVYDSTRRFNALRDNTMRFHTTQYCDSIETAGRANQPQEKHQKTKGKPQKTFRKPSENPPENRQKTDRKPPENRQKTARKSVDAGHLHDCGFSAGFLSVGSLGAVATNCRVGPLKH